MLWRKGFVTRHIFIWFCLFLVQIWVFGKCPGKKAPQKTAPEKIAPQKIVLLDFCYFWHYLPVVPFKNFIVTNFRGVSRTPATSIIDLLVTVVNGINYCRKKLLCRCCRRRTLTSEFIRWNFSMIYISKKHNLSHNLLKTYVQKIWDKGTVIEIAVQ